MSGLMRPIKITIVHAEQIWPEMASLLALQVELNIKYRASFVKKLDFVTTHNFLKIFFLV